MLFDLRLVIYFTTSAYPQASVEASLNHLNILT